MRTFVKQPHLSIVPAVTAVKATTVLRSAAIARVGIGAAFVIGARPLLSVLLRSEEPSESFVLFARTVGIRDTLFGLGCLVAGDDARRWVQLWLANETADVIAAIVASRRLGFTAGAAAAVSPLPLVAADIWVLRRLPRPDGDRHR
jgi:hypothetical protein